MTVHLAKVCDFKTTMKHPHDNFKLKKMQNLIERYLENGKLVFYAILKREALHQEE